MVFRIRLAEQLIEIHSIYEDVASFCSRYIDKIHPNEEPSVLIQVTPDDIKSIKVDDLQRNAIVEGISVIKNASGYMEILAANKLIATSLLRFDTFLFHGSVISTDGLGYMFSAPSGVGKTTRSRIWIQSIPNSFIVNGDKPLLKLHNDTIYAFGTPWCGKEGWNTNTKVPLRAIFLLERIDEEKGEESSITELTLSEAFLALLQQTYRSSDPEAMKKTLHLLKALDGKVKLYRFRGALSREAIRLAYETARPKEEELEKSEMDR